MRGEKELLDILEQSKEAFEREFYFPIEQSKGEILACLNEMVLERYKKFLFKRLNHLPDADLAHLTKLFSSGKIKVPEVKNEEKRTEEKATKGRNL